MALSIKHKKTATLPDQPGVEVNKAEWNDDHAITGTVDDTNLPNIVTPGSYTNTNLTVDAKGRITAAANGSSGGAVSSVSNADGSLTISPTTGAVVASLTFPINASLATSPLGQVVKLNSENFLGTGPLAYTLGMTLLGYQTGKNLAAGADSNTFIGYQSGSGASTTTCGFNTFVGWQAGRNVSSNNNVCVGYLAGPTLSQGSNVYVGREAGFAASSSNNNVGVGYQTLYTGTGSNNSQNVAIGREAGFSVTNGQNCFIGYRAGQNVTNVAQNIIIGYNCGNLVSNTTSNHLNIGNGIYGDLGTNALTPGSHTSNLIVDGSWTVQNLNGTGNRVVVADSTGKLAVGTANTDYQAPITLTTTGTSGAATFIANTLNIPQYTGGGAAYYTWSEVTGTSQTAAINNAYVLNNAGLVTLTLPTTAALGDKVQVAGKGAGGWKVAQNASQIIHFGNQNTTSGTGGSLASTLRYDCIELVCITANTDWIVVNSVGNVTVV